MNRAQHRQAARDKRKQVFLASSQRREEEVALQKASRLAWRVKKNPITPEEEKVLGALLDLLNHGSEVSTTALAALASIQPIEALIYLEHFKSELNGKPNHAYVKARLEEIAKLKERAAKE